MINSSTPDLNLRAGKVSSDILQAASPSLQEECKKKYPRGIKPGEIAQTKGYNVCEEIYHVNICSNFNSDSKQVSQRLHRAKNTDTVLKTVRVKICGFICLSVLLFRYKLDRAYSYLVVEWPCRRFFFMLQLSCSISHYC